MPFKFYLTGLTLFSGLPALNIIEKDGQDDSAEKDDIRFQQAEHSMPEPLTSRTSDGNPSLAVLVVSIISDVAVSRIPASFGKDHAWTLNTSKSTCDAIVLTDPAQHWNEAPHL